MNECCGHECTTPFCPWCSKRQPESHSLVGLYAYCVKTREAKKVLLTRNINKAIPAPDDVIEGNRLEIQKWSAWVEGLERIKSEWMLDDD